MSWTSERADNMAEMVALMQAIVIAEKNPGIHLLPLDGCNKDVVTRFRYRIKQILTYQSFDYDWPAWEKYK